MVLLCISCKKEITNDKGVTRFMCPNCGKAEIIRCLHCRKLAANYSCSLCGFSGPN